MLDRLDARAARRWAVASLAALGDAREEIDALNVYPVPDRDTGTNLFLTVEAACAEVSGLASDADLGQVARAFARGALLGARGNSGIITAQLLCGWADALAERGVLDGPGVTRALARADEQAWAAVGEPVEGTILSVSRAAALASAGAGERLGDVVSAASAAAWLALERTPEQLETLRLAGVVDAGGRGLVVLFDTLEALVHRRSLRDRSRSFRGGSLPVADLSRCEAAPPGGPAYEVMYLLDAAREQIPALRNRLTGLGDSLVVVGGAALWHVHVHVDDPGAAIEAGIDAGRPRRIRVAHFAAAGERWPAVAAPAAVGLVAVAAGPGLADLFAGAGAVVVSSGPGRRASTAELLDAVRRTNARSVVVLPNDPDTLPVARAAARAAREHGVRVSVLPTRAQVQGLAAAAVHDPARAPEDDLVQMSAAAGAARDGAVTVAVREAITTAGICRPGDALGVVQGDFAIVGSLVGEVAVEVVDRLLAGGGELVTLVTGVDADSALVRIVTDHLRGAHRDVEVSVLAGGQPRYHLLIGVE